jgi:hypothetical protein
MKAELAQKNLHVKGIERSQVKQKSIGFMPPPSGGYYVNPNTHAVYPLQTYPPPATFTFHSPGAPPTTTPASLWTPTNSTMLSGQAYSPHLIAPPQKKAGDSGNSYATKLKEQGSQLHDPPPQQQQLSQPMSYWQPPYINMTQHPTSSLSYTSTLLPPDHVPHRPLSDGSQHDNCTILH